MLPTLLTSLLLLPHGTSHLSSSAALPPDSLREIELNNAIVTEFKLNRRNLAPSSISSLSETHLHRQHLGSLKDLTAAVPNFFMPDYGSKQNSPIFVRGVGAKAKGNTMGFYVDGVPHVETSAFDLDLSDVSRIDLYRGPQGTLYGRNTIGGVLSVSTASPLVQQGTKIKVGYGSQNDLRLQASTAQRLLPNLGVALSVGHHSNGGYFRNYHKAAPADELTERYARLKLLWAFAPRWQASLTALVDHTKQGGYPYAPYDKQRHRADSVNYDGDSRYKRLVASAGLNLRYQGSNFSFNAQSAFQHLNDQQDIDQDFTPRPVYFVANRSHFNTLSQEFTVKSNHEGRYQWIVGAFALHQLLHNSVTAQYLSTQQDMVVDMNHRLPTTALALYHQSSLNLWRGFSVTAGLRFDYERATDDFAQRAYRLSTAADLHRDNQFHSQIAFREFSPKIALQYISRNRQLYYASLTRGYKAGGFNQSFRTEAERSFAPEYNWNYELGAKLKLLRGKLLADMAIFYIDWRDQQTTNTVVGVGNILLNAGRSQSHGAELSLTARPMRALDLTLNYGYTYAQFLRFEKLTTTTDRKTGTTQTIATNYAHKMLPLVPRHTLALNASYTLQTAVDESVVFNLGMTGVGKIYWAEDNATAQNFYALLNAKITFNHRQWSCELWARNLTATRYVAYQFALDRVGEFAQMGKPFHFGAALSYRF